MTWKKLFEDFISTRDCNMLCAMFIVSVHPYNLSSSWSLEDDADDGTYTHCLKIGFTPKDYTALCRFLDAHNSDELYATIWFDNQSWATLEDREGDYRFTHYIFPQIPEECKPR